MDSKKIDMFMMTNSSNFPEDKVMFIRSRMDAADESKWGTLSCMQFKSPITALILSLFLGPLGIDRFYIGSTAAGVFKFITCGGFGFWTLIDWFLIMGATREKNYERLSTIL